MADPADVGHEVENPCKKDWERRERSSAGDTLTERVGPMERSIAFRVGYDHRSHPEACGGGGHGQHGMEVVFTLKGPAGAVTWSFSLSNFVPGRASITGNVPSGELVSAIVPANHLIDDAYSIAIDVHTIGPRYEGQGLTAEPGGCALVPEDQPCYFDASYCAAGDLLPDFLAHGPMAVWAKLAEWYADAAKSLATEAADV